jgi:hypothetical protein
LLIAEDFGIAGFLTGQFEVLNERMCRAYGAHLSVVIVPSAYALG